LQLKEQVPFNFKNKTAVLNGSMQIKDFLIDVTYDPC
jgi:hypothetical protein